MPKLLPAFSIRTKLIVMMVSLSFLFVVFLFILYSRAERELIEEVKRNTEELSTAIQISIEQMSGADGGLEKFKGLKDLKKKGIREISVVNNSREVIASSNARLIGKKLKLKGESVRKIGNVTEYTTTRDGQKKYDILLPVVVGKESLGYIHMETQFDDLTAMAGISHRNRLMGTILIFSIGIVAAVYLSRKYTEPIQSIADAAQKVAGGDLTVRLKPGGNDELGVLTRNFNEMVEKLRENSELQAKLKEAEHMSKIGTLASGIAHEVRNPLNFINLSIDHLRATHGPEDENKREGFESSISAIKSEIERLNNMVSSFLNFGRPLNLKIKGLPLEHIIGETVLFLSESARAGKVSIDFRKSISALTVMADYTHIKTCFLNIILNAVQAMPEGGRLIIVTKAEGDRAFIRFTDTGAGISPENMEKIFEPYFTTKDLGIGLGLAFTRRIIEEHGGLIAIESEIQKGTTVTVMLPMGERA